MSGRISKNKHASSSSSDPSLSKVLEYSSKASHLNRKKSVCFWWKKGRCKKGKYCRYRHSGCVDTTNNKNSATNMKLNRERSPRERERDKNCIEKKSSLFEVKVWNRETHANKSYFHHGLQKRECVMDNCYEFRHAEVKRMDEEDCSSNNKGYGPHKMSLTYADVVCRGDARNNLKEKVIWKEVNVSSDPTIGVDVQKSQPKQVKIKWKRNRYTSPNLDSSSISPRRPKVKKKKSGPSPVSAIHDSMTSVETSVSLKKLMVLKVEELRILGENLKLKLSPRMKKKALQRVISTCLISLSKEQADVVTTSKDNPMPWSPQKKTVTRCLSKLLMNSQKKGFE